MIIKTNDGSFNVASKAETDTALGFGIGTLALQLLKQVRYAMLSLTKMVLGERTGLATR